MSLLSILNWIQQTPFATGLKESALVFPLVEGTHILSLAVSVCMIVILDLRLLRLTFRNQSVSLVMDQLIQVALPGFIVTLLTGAMLFSTEAVRAFGSPFFRAKMMLLAAAGVNAIYYRFRYYPRMPEWDLTTPPAGARVVAALSLIFWIGVIGCGRTMAYEF